MLRFDWDETKNERNRSKHGIWFEEARSVFDDDRARVFHDPEHSNEEDRFLIIGVNCAMRFLVVVHCYRQQDDAVIRIISARRATRKEIKFYEEGI